MTMYLPNPDVQPIGFDAAEFIELPPMADRSPAEPVSSEDHEGDPEEGTP